jgi:hypothetical protein
LAESDFSHDLFIAQRKAFAKRKSPVEGMNQVAKIFLLMQMFAMLEASNQIATSFLLPIYSTEGTEWLKALRASSRMCWTTGALLNDESTI